MNLAGGRRCRSLGPSCRFVQLWQESLQGPRLQGCCGRQVTGVGGPDRGRCCMPHPPAQCRSMQVWQESPAAPEVADVVLWLVGSPNTGQVQVPPGQLPVSRGSARSHTGTGEPVRLTAAHAEADVAGSCQAAAAARVSCSHLLMFESKAGAELRLTASQWSCSGIPTPGQGLSCAPMQACAPPQPSCTHRRVRVQLCPSLWLSSDTELCSLCVPAVWPSQRDSHPQAWRWPWSWQGHHQLCRRPFSHQGFPGHGRAQVWGEPCASHLPHRRCLCPKAFRLTPVTLCRYV